MGIKKWIKKAIVLIGASALMGFMAQPMVAQTTSFYTDRAVATFPINSQGVLIPIPYGQVRICSFPATGSPCTPVAPDITDINGNPLSVIGGGFGQITTDVVGRFSFGCSLGNSYQVQVASSASNTPQLNYPITCPGSGVNPTFGSVTATQFNSQTVNGLYNAGRFSSISAALTAAIAAGSPGVWIPCGTYTDNITITSPVTLEGEDKMCVIIRPSVAVNPLLKIDSSVNGGLDGVLINNVTLQCSALPWTQACGDAIQITGSQVANQINDHLTFRDIIIGNMYQLNSAGTLNFLNGVNIIGRTIYSNFEYVMEFGARNNGFVINPGQGVGTSGPVNFLHVVNSSFFGNFNYGITMNCTGSNSSCTSNHFDTVESTENGLNTALSPCTSVLINTVWEAKFTNFYAEADCLNSADANAALIRVTGSALTPNQVDISTATLVMTSTGAKYGIYDDAVRAGGTWDGLRFIFIPATAPVHIATTDPISHIEILNASNMGKPDIVADGFGATHVSIPALGVLAKTVINNAAYPVSANTFSLCSIVGNTVWGMTDIGVTAGPVTINTFTCGLANQTLRVCSDSGTITLAHLASGAGQMSFDSATPRVLQSNQCVYLRHIIAADQWNEVAGLGAGLLATANTWTQNQSFNGIFSKYNNVSTVANGIPQLVAKFDATAQSANVASTLLYAVPANGAGSYRASCSIIVTQAATTSSTLPACEVVWTDNDTGGVEPSTSFSGTNSANAVGTASASAGALGGGLINAKASTNINFTTLGYASSGATPMQFAVHVKLEYLGN